MIKNKKTKLTIIFLVITAGSILAYNNEMIEGLFGDLTEPISETRIKDQINERINFTNKDNENKEMEKLPVDDRGDQVATSLDDIHQNLEENIFKENNFPDNFKLKIKNERENLIELTEKYKNNLSQGVKHRIDRIFYKQICEDLNY